MTSREFSHTDRNVQLLAIFTQWLPLADAVLKMVSAHLPSPLGLSEERVERLMTGNSSQRFDFFCGHVSQGQELYVLHPRYEPRDPGETPDLRVARSLYKTCTS